MPLQRLAQEPLGSCQVAPLTEPELDGVAVAVDSTVEIPPLGSDFNVGLVDVLLASDGSLAPIEPLQQFGRIVHCPPMNGRVIDGDASFCHHLLQISEAEIVSEIPPDAEQDHRPIKMPAFERRAFRHWKPVRVADIRKQKICD